MTEACSSCGQTDHGQHGEYPCPECGLPQLWGEVSESITGPLFITPTTLYNRIQAAAEWCQQTEHEFIRAGILDRLDDVETVMLGWDEDREEIASPLEGGD